MIVEIRGVEFINKGAELMMHAVVQQISNTYERGIVAARLRIGNFRQREQAGLHHLLARDSDKLPLIRPTIDILASLIPQSVRHLNRIVINAEIQGILDASGFRYSDQFALGNAEYMAKASKAWKKEGKKVVLLPQAFGPLENPRLKTAVLHMLENVDLVFARDLLSYDYLTSLGGPASHIRRAPDFTNLIEGRIPEYLDVSSPQPCIIPNSKMISSTDENVRRSYLSFLRKCTDYLLQKGTEPFVLIHETRTDERIAVDLKTGIGRPIKIIRERDPLFIKGILGKCSMVVGSRFHGLINAASQGVPILGTGWSHKYQSLFDDYSCPEYLVSPTDSDEMIFYKIDMLLEEPSRSAIIKRLKQAGKKQRKLALHMWDEVHNLLQAKSG